MWDRPFSLQEFPNDGIASVVRNVFDFDAHSSDTSKLVFDVMQKWGIPVGTSMPIYLFIYWFIYAGIESPSERIKLSPAFALPELRVIGNWRLQDDGQKVPVRRQEMKKVLFWWRSRLPSGTCHAVLSGYGIRRE